jgi:hypothetical protein
MHMRDWFNVGAIPSTIGIGLYGFVFALSFRVPTMSPLAECLWITGAVVLIGISWFSSAKAAQAARESKEQARIDSKNTLEGINKIHLLLSNPNTTLAKPPQSSSS